MGELDRSQAVDIFTEVLESTPCIIVFSSQALEFSKNYLKSSSLTAREIFESMMGVHECKIVYKGKDKKENRKYQFIFEKEKISIYLSARQNLAEFQLAYVSDEEFVIPVDPEEFRSATLKIFSEEYINHNTIDFLDSHDLMTSYKEIKEFCKSLETLKEPVREINRAQSRKMWKAYIEGEKALNTDKKNLFVVTEVGKVVREFYNERSMQTVTIKIQAPTIQQRFTKAIQGLPSIKYKNPNVIFKTNNAGEISFNGFVDISDEIMEDISTTSADNCFKVSDAALHALFGSLHLQSTDNLENLLKEINDSLTDFDADYAFDDQTGIYSFKDDTEALYLDKLIENSYKETLCAVRNTMIVCKFSSKQDLDELKQGVSNLPGVIEVLDPVNGQLMLRTDGKVSINTNDDTFSNLRLASCRAVFTPNSFNPAIEIDGLRISGSSYVYTTNDCDQFRQSANAYHQKVIEAYEKKQFIRKEYDYGCFIVPNKAKLRNMQLALVGHKQIKVKSAIGVAEFYPESYENYQQLINQIKELCDDSIELSIEKYQPSVVVKLLSDEPSYCKTIFNSVSEKLSSVNPSFQMSVIDEDDYRDFDYSVEYEDVEALDLFKTELAKQLSLYPTLLSNEFKGTDNGKTLLPFVFDHALNVRFEKKLRCGFVNEDINLVKASEYDAITEAIDLAYELEYQDYDEINDLRRSRTEILRNALKLGRCIARKLDSIKFEISREFSEYMEDRSAKGNVSKFIHVGDYLQFPMVGKSSELKRLSDSMLRITNPNEYYPGSKTRRIPAPANPRLSDFLFDPRYAGEFEEDIEIVKKRITETKIEEFLNEKQLEAVAKAVSAPDIAIIQGPPGTGKTTVIAEIIRQQILKKPNSKILLTSQTNLAVDNALERLQGRRGIRPVRIQNASTDKEIGIEARRYLLDFMEDWCEAPSDENKDNGANLWMDSILRDMDDNAKYASVLKQWREDLTKRDRSTRDQFFNAYKSNVNLVAATCSICGSKQLQEVYSMLYGDSENAFDVVIMDEASKATPLEMSVPMVWGKKIIIIGDHKQLPPMMQEDNIITSLKKAGQQVLADTIESFKESQFEILFRSAIKRKPSIVATLDKQYRMHKQIMNTVGHFYSEELEDGLLCGLADEDMENKNYNARGSRYHGFSLPGLIEPQTHALWVNVDSFESQPSGSTSYVNNGELNAIKTVLKALQKAEGFNEFMDSQKKPEDKEIGVITFYGAQYGKIKEMYKEGAFGDVPCRINVVDKFQGMERNIIIISTVRHNKEHRYGFAEDIRRINVGFSRARRLLIVVGNRQFFRQNPHYMKSIDEMEHLDIKQIQDVLR